MVFDFYFDGVTVKTGNIQGPSLLFPQKANVCAETHDVINIHGGVINSIRQITACVNLENLFILSMLIFIQG